MQQAGAFPSETVVPVSVRKACGRITVPSNGSNARKKNRVNVSLLRGKGSSTVWLLDLACDFSFLCWYSFSPENRETTGSGMLFLCVFSAQNKRVDFKKLQKREEKPQPRIK